MNVVLIGYMGSGKSTIGRNLAKILHYEYLDLDNYIQEKEGNTISEIFEKKGEIYFRKIENLYLKQVLTVENTVISLGGGTPCYGNNMQTIISDKNVKSLYLKTSIPQLVERLEHEKHKRPLIAHLKTKEQLVEFIGKHLFERSFFYNQCEVNISTDKKSVEAIVEEIVLELF